MPSSLPSSSLLVPAPPGELECELEWGEPATTAKADDLLGSAANGNAGTDCLTEALSCCTASEWAAAQSL